VVPHPKDGAAKKSQRFEKAKGVQEKKGAKPKAWGCGKKRHLGPTSGKEEIAGVWAREIGVSGERDLATSLFGEDAEVTIGGYRKTISSTRGKKPSSNMIEKKTNSIN